MTENTTLTRESQVFDGHLDEWRESHSGEWVLIKGSNVVGFYPTLEVAFKAGTERFGLDPFFVKQIVPGDTVNISFYGRRTLAAS